MSEGPTAGGDGPRPVRRRPADRRRAARIGAVQALYQIEVTGAPVEHVVEEFQAYRLANLLEPLDTDEPPPDVDRAWFARIVRGAAASARGELDPMISANLADGWSLERIGYALRACLRAGAYELASCRDVPIRVVINEYIEVARAFFEGEEPGFVNAVLDKIAGQLRPEEKG